MCVCVCGGGCALVEAQRRGGPHFPAAWWEKSSYWWVMNTPQHPHLPSEESLLTSAAMTASCLERDEHACEPVCTPEIHTHTHTHHLMFHYQTHKNTVVWLYWKREAFYSCKMSAVLIIFMQFTCVSWQLLFLFIHLLLIPGCFDLHVLACEQQLQISRHKFLYIFFP